MLKIVLTAATEETLSKFLAWPAACSCTPMADAMFAQPDFNEPKWIYSQPVPPTNHHLLARVPIIFEVIGRISPAYCYLTTTGDAYYDVPDSQDFPLASCWLEAPETNKLGAITEWVRMMDQLNQLGLDMKLERSQFVSKKPDEQYPKLQVIWGPTTVSFCSLRSNSVLLIIFNLQSSRGLSLPLFDELGKQYAPRSVCQVPFGKHVRALFHIVHGSESIMARLILLKLLE